MTKNTFFAYAVPKNSHYEIDLTDKDVPDISANTDPTDILSLFFHATDTELSQPQLKTVDSDRQTRRYFADTLVCYDCGGTGHINRACPRRPASVCLICAKSGHFRNDCPMQVCHFCYKCGHQPKDCKAKDPKRFVMCKVCPTGDHTVRDCPLEWRTYVLKKGAVVDISKIRYKSCPLCFSTNHFLDDCKKSRSKVSIFNSNFMKITRFRKK